MTTGSLAERQAVPGPYHPELARLLAAEGVGAGEVVALVGPNEPAWLAGYQALLDVGAAPLLLDVDAPAAERRRWLDRAGGARILDTSSGTLTGPSCPPAASAGTVFLPSSGTSGAPKLIGRTLASLTAEGARHQRWSDLQASDEVILPLPMWHAYALGWVHAALAAGCPLHPVPPTALARCLHLVNEGGTVLALVPVTAGLLAARAARSLSADHRLRLAMVGAGAVDEDLEVRFRSATGVGLARNYGSSETGALFSGPAGIPAGCVGRPLAGVEFRLGHETGELSVRVDGADWYPTGDLATRTDDGLVVRGRRSRAIRRGDRWVAPEEVEAVLQAHPDVVEARAFGGPARSGRSESLHGEVVSVHGAGAPVDELRAYLADHLAPHKMPDRVRVTGDLPRGHSGKVVPPRPLALADAGTLVGCAQAYKRAELLFTLLRLGVLDRLSGAAATPAELADDLGLDHAACEQLMRVAAECGLVRVADGSAEPNGMAEEAAAILRLEELLSRSWVTRERLGEVAAHGVVGRGFERERPDGPTRSAYQRAMHPAAAARRTRMGLALAGHRTGPLLEITCGPGRYVSAAGAGDIHRVGPLSEPVDQTCPPGPYPLVVVCNAVHLDGTGSDLRRLAGLVAPGGRLLVDDVFLDVPGGVPAEVRLDWLTHGGLSWPTVSTVLAGLAGVGLAVERVVHTGQPAATLLVASRGD